MASSTSIALRQELMATGENSSTWGAKLNTNLGILESAITGTTSVSTTGGTTTLTNVDYTNDQAKKAVIDVSGVLVSDATVVVPNVSKVYKVFNRTSGSFTVSVKTSSGTAIAINQSTACEVYCNGSDVMRFLTPMADFTTGAPATASGAAASAVSVTPSGNLSSTNAQAALSELQGDINTINSTLTSSYQPVAARLTDFSSLGVGTTGYALIADAGVSANMKWSPLVPAGTDVLMYESSVLGWTVNTSNTNCAVRIVSSGGGAFTSGTAFTSVFQSRTISQANLPNYTLPETLAISTHGNHTHTTDFKFYNSASPSGGTHPFILLSSSSLGTDVSVTSNNNSSALSHTITGSVTSGGSGTAMDFAVAYVNVSIFSKSAY